MRNAGNAEQGWLIVLLYATTAGRVGFLRFAEDNQSVLVFLTCDFCVICQTDIRVTPPILHIYVA